MRANSSGTSSWIGELRAASPERLSLFAIQFRKGTVLGGWFVARDPNTRELVVEYEKAEGERRTCESSRHDTPIDGILSSAIGHSEKGEAMQFREAMLWVEG